mmetsp:Transcript_20473/g.56817  ORF Transcript_20473/g.56817 Transcript_20473/m.56817 type:complete len:200 (-) Transcript_20473:80-679(-)
MAGRRRSRSRRGGGSTRHPQASRTGGSARRSGVDSGGADMIQAVTGTAALAACRAASKEFARRAADIVASHVEKVAEVYGAEEKATRLEDEVRSEALAVLDLEEGRGRRLAQLRSRADELHRHLRTLSSNGTYAGAPTIALGFGGGGSFATLPALQAPAPRGATAGGPTRLPEAAGAPRRGQAIAPWAISRRTERPRLL